jgi:hypothetical protein
MKSYMVVYQTKTPDFEAIHNRAKEIEVQVEYGGGRDTKGGVSPNAQLVLDLKDLDSKVSIARTGRIIIYYPSKPRLEKCLEVLMNCYVPTIMKSDLKCQGPIDPTSKTFELRMTENWNGTGLTLCEAEVMIYQWFDPKTGEYIFVLPDDDGRVEPPADPDCTYADCCSVTISAIDKDDEKGNRVVTGEKIRWKAMQELRRVAKEHRLTPEDLKRAQLRNSEKSACPEKT